jgi:hypothetical protein
MKVYVGPESWAHAHRDVTGTGSLSPSVESEAIHARDTGSLPVSASTGSYTQAAGSESRLRAVPRALAVYQRHVDSD